MSRIDPISAIQADFDRIALVSGDVWNHNGHYHTFLLQHLPSPCRAALEIGCGTGAFSCLLAERSEHVLALDLSPQMIRIARERSAHFPHIDFQVADALTYEYPPGHFECVASIATLHHLPLGRMLERMKGALRPGGVLLVLDLFRGEGLADFLTSALAIPMSVALRLVKTGRFRRSRAVREAWAEHGKRDAYLTLSRVRQICEGVLPGAEVRKHLLWRYSIIWEKGAER